MSAWLVYWIMMLDNIRVGLSELGSIGIGICIMISSTTIICFCVHSVNKDSKDEYDLKTARKAKNIANLLIKCLKWASVLVVLYIFSIFIPTTKQACIIYVLPKIANNEQVQQIPKKLLDVANKQLDEWVKEYTEKGTQK